MWPVETFVPVRTNVWPFPPTTARRSTNFLRSQIKLHHKWRCIWLKWTGRSEISRVWKQDDDNKRTSPLADTPWSAPIFFIMISGCTVWLKGWSMIRMPSPTPNGVLACSATVSALFSRRAYHAVRHVRRRSVSFMPFFFRVARERCWHSRRWRHANRIRFAKKPRVVTKNGQSIIHDTIRVEKKTTTLSELAR